MDPRYEQIYDLIYLRSLDSVEYLRRGDIPWRMPIDPYRIRDPRSWDDLHRLLRRSIEQHDSELREDAKAFLHMNLAQLVILPVVARGDRRSIEVLRESIAGDVEAVVREARGGSLNQPGSETSPISESQKPITAHAMIDALARSWDRLETMKLRVWGPSNDQRDYETRGD